jgi:hypothetical protein
VHKKQLNKGTKLWLLVATSVPITAGIYDTFLTTMVLVENEGVSISRQTAFVFPRPPNRISIHVILMKQKSPVNPEKIRVRKSRGAVRKKMDLSLGGIQTSHPGVLLLVTSTNIYKYIYHTFSVQSQRPVNKEKVGSKKPWSATLLATSPWSWSSHPWRRWAPRTTLKR